MVFGRDISLVLQTREISLRKNRSLTHLFVLYELVARIVEEKCAVGWLEIKGDFCI